MGEICQGIRWGKNAEALRDQQKEHAPETDKKWPTEERGGEMVAVLFNTIGIFVPARADNAMDSSSLVVATRHSVCKYDENDAAAVMKFKKFRIADN